MPALYKTILCFSLLAIAIAVEIANLTRGSTQGAVLHLIAFSPTERISTLAGTQDSTSYTVVAGDDLYHISLRFGITLACLEADNPQISDPDLIFPGDVIHIPSQNSQISYTVIAGDDLFNIASKFNVTLEAVEAANPQITDPELIFPGQVITIPASCAGSGESPPNTCSLTYTVIPGDYLYEIAGRFGVSLDALEAANRQFKDPDLIFPGDQVTIPIPCSTTSSSTSSPTSPGSSSTSSTQSSSQTSTKTSSKSSSETSLTSSTTSSETASKTSSTKTSSTTSQSETEVIIDGSTIIVGTGASTVIINSETIVVGPGGIGVGTETFPLPTFTGTTVLTSDGITITLAPEPIPPENQHSTTSSETDVVIGGSTFVIGTGSSTVTIGSETVIIGPSGIQIGTDTIPLPPGTAPTPITTDGITLTIEPEPISSASQAPLTSTETEVVIGGSTFEIGTGSSTIVIGSETIIIGPSGIQIGTDKLPLPIATIPVPITTDGVTLTIEPIPIPIITTPTPTATEVIIDGSTFVIGTSSSTEIIDGETIIIGPGGIKVGTDPPIPIPIVTATTAETTDGLTFTFFPLFPGGSSSGSPPIIPPDISLGPQTSVETGSFSTKTISVDLSTYSETITTIDGHHTVLPIWPCLFPPIPFCAIIVIPFPPFPGAPLPIGGIIPPPSCQPEITFGSNLLPTPIFTGELCTPTFTVTQTTTISSLDGGFSLSIFSYDNGFTDEAPSSTSSTTSITTDTPPITIIQAPSSTFPAPTATASCQPIGLQEISGSTVITIPAGDDGITIFAPWADGLTTLDSITFQAIDIDPWSVITFWQIDQGPETIPIANGPGGTEMPISWGNSEGGTGTRLTLFFEPGQGTITFDATYQGFIDCPPPAPPPPPPSTTLPPPSLPTQICPGTPSPLPPVPNLQCRDTFQGNRIDCLQLTIPSGIDVGAGDGDRGITSADCLDGTMSVNADGAVFCTISQVDTCGVVVVFDDPSTPLSRNDIVLLLNDSNEFCFIVCGEGPFESSVFTNAVHGPIRVCVMDPHFADQC